MAKKKKRNTKQKKQNNKLVLSSLSIRLIGLLLLFFVITMFLKLGIVGNSLNNGIVYLFGDSIRYVFYGLVFLYSLFLIVKGAFYHALESEMVGGYLLLISLTILVNIDKTQKGMDVIKNYIDGIHLMHGGLIGAFFYGILSSMFDSIGALVAGIILLMMSIILIDSKLYRMYREYRINHPKIKEEKTEPEITKVYVKQKGPKLFRKEKELPLFPDEVFNDYQVKEDDEITTAFVFNENKGQLDIVEKKKPETKIPFFELDNEEKKKVKPVKKNNSGNYELPPLDLLNSIKRNNQKNNDTNYSKHTAGLLENLLKEFGVHAKVENIHIGPTVTKYELKLEIGTRVNKILSLQDDIQLALAAKEIRIEAPIPGKPYVGIEIPNPNPVAVTYREVMELARRDRSWENKLSVPLGKDIEGKLVVAPLDAMPHLLIAGATGSGKSVCINVIITSLIMKATPEEVRLILVDPKKVELSNYNGIPHLLAPVVTDPKKAAGVLQEVVAEMERRYEVFAKYNQKNITSYNQFAKENNQSKDEKLEIMSYHVVVLDEVADLMMVASKTVEDCIMRLAQMARAAGIHLIIATQRPSTNVITGVIKANIPSRIAFAVSSQIDSRTILDASGAEKLLGKGDMLYSPMSANSPTRIQGAYVADAEIERIVDFVSSQSEVNYEDKYVNAKELSNDHETSESSDDLDEEYEDCRAYVIQMQKASTSLLQRRFKIGYNKAARIMDQLEENGVVGPQIGSKPREVYIQSYEEE